MYLSARQLWWWGWGLEGRKMAQCGCKQQLSWICNTCIGTLLAPSLPSVCFVSFPRSSPRLIQRPCSFTSHISSASPPLIPLSLLHAPLSTNQLRSNYTQLAPHFLPTGALEGQKIPMLTDVNLHDFLASISTTVVCLCSGIGSQMRRTRRRRRRRGRACQYLVTLCNLEQ